MYGQGNQMGFGPPVTPPIIKNIIIANAAVFIAQLLLPSVIGFDAVTRFGAVSAYGVWHEWNLWQPFTYMWLHDTHSLMHILFNMFALYMFGGVLETAWGSRRFLRFIKFGSKNHLEQQRHDSLYFFLPVVCGMNLKVLKCCQVVWYRPFDV